MYVLVNKKIKVYTVVMLDKTVFRLKMYRSGRVWPRTRKIYRRVNQKKEL